MKSLVSYYSRTNITKKLAESIAGKVNADIEEIIPIPQPIPSLNKYFIPFFLSFLENNEFTENPEQRWEKIEQLIRSSNVFENEILYIALNSDDYNLFDTVLQNEYAWRKMFTVVDELDTKSSIVRGYSLNTTDDETLMLLAQIKAVELGKIYYDYGEWLEPSDKYPGRGKYNLSGHIFDEMRFYETAAALSNLLAKIPREDFDRACFVIDGHTDSVSDHDFNQALSERRALSIKRIMNGMFGIPQHRIVTQGFSWDKKAVEKETTPNDFAMNRRAEIKVCFFEEQ